MRDDGGDDKARWSLEEWPSFFFFVSGSCARDTGRRREEEEKKRRKKERERMVRWPCKGGMSGIRNPRGNLSSRHTCTRGPL